MRRCLLFLGLAVALTQPAGAEFTPSGLLEIHIFDVGQANAALVIGPNGKKVMLEAGAVADGKVYDYLIGLEMVPGPAGDKLDHTLVGHLHSDHYQGFRRIFPPDPTRPQDDWVGFHVAGSNWYNDSPEIAGTGTEMGLYRAAAVRSGGGAPQAVDQNWSLVLGDDAWMRVVAVNGWVYDYDDAVDEWIEPRTDDENDRSVAILIHYGAFDFLWASDLTGGNDSDCVPRGVSVNDVETPLARALTPEPDGSAETAPELLTALGVDVLQVNHHGSHKSTNSFYVGRLKPEVAVISVGSHGTYKHPRQVVVDDVLRAPASACKPAPPALVLQTSEGYDHELASDSGYCVGDILIMTDGVFYGIGATGGSPDERADAGLPAYFAVDDVAPDCPMEVDLAGLYIDFPWEWRAKHSITSTGSVRLAAGADVLLQAGNLIRLADGFTVESDALLTLGLEPFTACATPSP